MPEITPSRYMVQASWDDVPHLDEKAKRELLAGTPPHLRDARSKGIPSLGSGAIYPISEEDITCDAFSIPPYWPRAYALDVGWNRTACVWGAHDPETDICYIYSEHYVGQQPPLFHAEAIKARGDWIRGVVDPAARGRSQVDGIQLMREYIGLGLNLVKADNSIEAGIYAVWGRLSTGRLKIFKNCNKTLAEYRVYRRDEKGAIVKANDHAMDALRYYVMTGRSVERTKPVAAPSGGKGFIGAGDIRTGY